MNPDVLPIVLAGGAGARLWPLSREAFPKQFLKLVNAERSMLQETLSRIDGLGFELPLVICNEEHRFLAAEQLRQFGQLNGNLLLEPFSRNTAPAIALAAFKAMSTGRDPILLVLPADHLISNIGHFHKTIARAVNMAEKGRLVTLGIVPSRAETGFGYIEQGDAVGSGYKVERFIEKPDVATADEFLKRGNFLWNSGMFAFKASVYLDELKQYRPEIYRACQNATVDFSADLDFQRVDLNAFEKCPSESIDYAVMEHTDKAVVLPLDAGWSDVGTWSSLWETLEKDADNNLHRGDVIATDTQNNLVYAESGLVTTLGVSDLVIVQTKDALLVADRNRASEVKGVVAALESRNRAEHKSHREVFRPWGKYDLVDVGSNFQVKKITVDVAQKLSLQKHAYRSEHWVVVSGVARVTLGDERFELVKNQSVYIPVGAVHSLENTGDTPLELIEVQSGDYLGEDDIVRFEDRYGRA